MRRLTVLYDDRCSFCRSCRRWLEKQPQLVKLEFLPARGMYAAEAFPGLDVQAGEELVVVDDDGGVYRGDDAFLMCLWAMEDYREWADRLAGAGWQPLARGFFHQLSKSRGQLSKIVDWWNGEAEDACGDGGCSR
jgi:predicted DCC family thiol-disulfide oxidoreductase YuxK